MSLVELCQEGDLEVVKAALKSGADVNTKDKYGHTGLYWAVSFQHNSVVALLLNTPNIDVNQSALHWAAEKNNSEVLKLLLNVQNIDVNNVDYSGKSALHEAVLHNNNSVVVALLLNTPNIDVNQKDNQGWPALYWAVEFEKLNEGLKLLLNDPRLDVNIVDKDGWSAVFRAVYRDNIEAVKLLLNVPTIDVNIVDNYGCGVVHIAVDAYTIGGLKLLLNHPSLTSLTLNRKDNENGDTPVMWAVKMNKLKHLKVLVADPRVDLDTTDKEGRSLEKVARDPETRKVVAEAKQRREEKRRLIGEQQRQVSKVLLDGLYDPDSPISKLLGVRTEIMEEIIWQKLVENWQIFPENMLWC